MPRRTLLTTAQRSALLAFPSTEDELIRHYTLSAADLVVIRQHRGGQHRLGFAVQLCALRYPGGALSPDAQAPEALLAFVARQLRVDRDLWSHYAQRAETRREHLLERQTWLALTPFGAAHFRHFVVQLTDLARQTDQGIVLAHALLEALRHQHVIVPAVEIIERVCAQARTQGTRKIYAALTATLSVTHQQRLNDLLTLRENATTSSLAWLRQPAGRPNAKHVLIHSERLRAIRGLELPEGLERSVHQHRLLKLAREGGQMTAQHLRDLEPLRRYATLIAVVLDLRSTLLDEIIDRHDRILGTLFARAKRHHVERFQASGKSINAKLRIYSRIGRALLEAKQTGNDPFAAIEAIVSWAAFADIVTEAEKLAEPDDFDYLPLVSEGFTQLRRYTPALLDARELKAAPAARDLLAGVNTVRDMNQHQLRKVPNNAPTSFVRKRWERVVYTDDGLDRRFYELCVLSELQNALRSGDIWAQGSRQFQDFEE